LSREYRLRCTCGREGNGFSVTATEKDLAGTLSVHVDAV
jgi:hypothetical protein